MTNRNLRFRSVGGLRGTANPAREGAFANRFKSYRVLSYKARRRQVPSAMTGIRGSRRRRQRRIKAGDTHARNKRRKPSPRNEF